LSGRPSRGGIIDKNTAIGHFDSLSDDFRAKKAYFDPLSRNSIRLSVATFIESPTFRRHRGFEHHESKTQACQGRGLQGRGEEGAKEEEGPEKKGQEEVDGLLAAATLE